MDNFMDKLAEKYNAQDMIRANAQAESAQMQSLQEQVDAYEAVLQEMRKLNYKNTELTQKMYALVDESIEKVRTLQIEAEGGANTEQVSKEMSEAVNRAMSEAVSNLDETMVRSLTQTLENALQQPADQLRQSTEDVKNSVVAVQSSADDMRSGVEGLRGDIDTLYQQGDEIRQAVDGIREAIDALKASQQESVTREMPVVSAEPADSVLKEDISGLGSDVKESINGLDSSVKESLSGLESSVKGSVDQLSGDIGSIKDEIGSIKDDMGGLQDKLFAIQQSGSNTEDMINSVAIAVKELGEKDSAGDLDSSVKDSISGLEGNVKESINGLDSNIRDGFSDIQEKLSALQQSGSNDEAIEKIYASIDELKAAIAALAGAKTADDSEAVGRLGNSIEELKTYNNENRTALEDIFTVLQSTKSEVLELRKGTAEAAEIPVDEEVHKALTELLSSRTEFSTGLRNLKQATDENKNTIKSALDSSVYGLKQDNKEIVEFLQRMNANIMKKSDDEAKAAQKEEEALARAEEERRNLEERFKAAEDFMHKESVKVYRNVQAVINEKNDKQQESVENANLSVEKRVGKVKALVVINMVFTLISLATMILYIFGFLGAH